MDWSEHYKNDSGYRDWPNEELVRFLSKQTLGERILEVGCGGGGNLRVIAWHGRATGLDGHHPALTHARELLIHTRQAEDVRLCHGDIFDLPFGDGSFSGLVDCMVSQHVPWVRHGELYRQYRRVLRPGGWLFLYHLDDETDCGRVSLGGYDVDALDLFPSVGFFCLPRRDALADMVEAAGFKAVTHGLKREYADGRVASYTVIEAVAV